MTQKSKRILAAALAVWLLVAIWLASRTLDDLRSGKNPGGSGETLTLEQILFPSLKMRDQE
jgi:hypothetical protein